VCTGVCPTLRQKPISLRSCRRTQFSWVLMKDPLALGPAAKPKRNGYWRETQFSWVLMQDLLALDPAADQRALGYDAARGHWVRTRDPRALGPEVGSLSLGSCRQTQDNYNNDNIYNTNNNIFNFNNINYHKNNNIDNTNKNILNFNNKFNIFFKKKIHYNM